MLPCHSFGTVWMHKRCLFALGGWVGSASFFCRASEWLCRFGRTIFRSPPSTGSVGTLFRVVPTAPGPVPEEPYGLVWCADRVCLHVFNFSPLHCTGTVEQRVSSGHDTASFPFDRRVAYVARDIRSLFLECLTTAMSVQCRRTQRYTGTSCLGLVFFLHLP